MNRSFRVYPFLSVLFAQAILFLMLARRGVPMVTSAGVSGVVAVAGTFARMVWQEEHRQQRHWTQVLSVRGWSATSRAHLRRSAMAAFAFAVVLVLLGIFFV